MYHTRLQCVFWVFDYLSIGNKGGGGSEKTIATYVIEPIAKSFRILDNYYYLFFLICFLLYIFRLL